MFAFLSSAGCPTRTLYVVSKPWKLSYNTNLPSLWSEFCTYFTVHEIIMNTQIALLLSTQTAQTYYPHNSSLQPLVLCSQMPYREDTYFYLYLKWVMGFNEIGLRLTSIGIGLDPCVTSSHDYQKNLSSTKPVIHKWNVQVGLQGYNANASIKRCKYITFPVIPVKSFCAVGRWRWPGHNRCYGVCWPKLLRCLVWGSDEVMRLFSLLIVRFFEVFHAWIS